MSGDVTEHPWTEKGTGGSRFSGHLALACVSGIVIGVTYFKLKPYLNPEPQVHAFLGHDQAEHRSAQDKNQEKELKDSLLTKILFASHLGGLGGNLGGGGPSRGPRSHVRIIERPLFDGLSVTVRATLIRGVSSLQPDPRIEAELVSFIPEEGTRELDDASVRGSKLLGVAIPNLDLKRMVLNFGELVTPAGKSIAILATAIDPVAQTQGVEANSASGIGSRLLGVGISQVMRAGDQVFMAKFLPGPSSVNLTQQATSQAARQINDQAATDVSLEATKGLRDTKPELSLPSGTALTLRLRVSPQALETGGGS